MLYLLPNVLDESQDHKLYLPPIVNDVIATLDGLIAESERAGFRYLKHFALKRPLQEMIVKVLNEHTKPNEIHDLIVPLKKGESWGLISDAGLPCIADPGSQLVELAHKNKIPVTAYPGPNSIILALQLSGFSGQRFCFHGYLPKEEKERIRQLKVFESDAKKFGRTQLFIETPYRTKALLQELISVLDNSTKLCIAANLLTPESRVLSQTIAEWKKQPLPLFDKIPAVFVLSCS